jgi:PqqD family protein of HPr-rel-A system
LAVPPEYVPQRRVDVLELDMGDGFVLYNDEASLVHHLNPQASLVWQICDGEASVQEIATDIAAEFETDESEVLGQVRTLIAELDALGIVHDARTAS